MQDYKFYKVAVSKTLITENYTLVLFLFSINISHGIRRRSEEQKVQEMVGLNEKISIESEKWEESLEVFCWQTSLF